VAVVSNYPLTNLQDAHRSAETRYTWDNSGSLNLYFYSATKVAVTGVALVDCNLNDITNTPTPPLTLYASDGTAGSTPAADFYAWNLYPYETETGVLRWYPNLTHGSASTTNGTPFSSDLAANGANLWTLRFAGDYGSFAELRIGAVVLSVVEPITLAAGASLAISDPSPYAEAYDGTTYVDLLDPFSTVTFQLPPLSHSGFYDLAKKLKAHGPRQQILDVHGYAATTDGGQTTTAVDRASAYYGRLSAGSIASATLTAVTNTVVDMSFTESRG